MEGMELDLPPRRKEKCLRDGIVYYEDSVIGKGQFGTVYKGYCKYRKCEVAVKMLHDITSSCAPHPSHLHFNEGGAEEAAGTGKVRPPPEISVLTQLKARDCPNILRLHSSWIKKTNSKNPNRVYVIVTEYCPGGDLHHWMQTKGKVSEAVARSLIYQLCNALLVFKSECIIHRDIKPANLFLTSENLEEAVLKVGDLGMAKSAAANLICDTTADRESAVVSSVLFHSALGTPMYMSPERIRQRPYSYQADVYSAGMVLYELMVGRPVRATRPAQLLLAVPAALQREVARHAAPPPPWLDLLCGMADEDPRRRLSVEAVLRHPWFGPAGGAPLPPLTVPLPPPGIALSLAPPLHASLAPPPPGPSAPADAVQNSALLSESGSCKGSVQDSPLLLAEDLKKNATWWTTLSVSGPVPAFSDAGPELSAASGPYVVTYAVRNFVWCVLLYVVEAEAEAASVLIVLSFLMDLIQNGYSAFVQDMEQLGGLHPAQHFVYLNDVWHGLLNHLNALVAHHRRRLPLRLWQRLYPRAEALILRKALSYIQEDAISDAAGGGGGRRALHGGDAAAPFSGQERWGGEKASAAAPCVDPDEAQGMPGGYEKALTLLRVLAQQAVLAADEVTGQALSTYSPPHGVYHDTVPYQQTQQDSACVEVSRGRPRLKYLIYVPVLAPFEDEEGQLMVHTILRKLSSYMTRTGTR